MQFGSIFGHGAYLGPDFTADYLHRAAVLVQATSAADGPDASERTIDDFRINTHDPATSTIVYSPSASCFTLIAAGLEWLGGRSIDPWASRTLAACRPPTRHASNDEPDWPHSEVPAFHLGVAAVVLVAASVIATLSAVRHVGPLELVVHAALLAIIAVRIRHVVIEWRTPMRRPQRSTTTTAGDV